MQNSTPLRSPSGLTLARETFKYGPMKKKRHPSRLWYPRGIRWATICLLFASLLELVVHRIALFFHKPSHELAEIPTRFKFLVPFATFSVYLLQLLSILLLAYFTLYALRVGIESRARRITLGVTLFFSLPVLAINGLLIPTHTMNSVVWYYLCTLTLLTLFGYTVWFLAPENHSLKTLASWYLLLSPALMLLSARVITPEAMGMEARHSFSLVKVGNYLYLFQGLAWPLLLLRRPLHRPLLIGISLLPTLLLALWFRDDPSRAATLLYGGFRINLPLGLSGKILFFLSFWGSMLTLLTLLSQPRWNRILGLTLLLWMVQGFAPYREVELLPFVVLFLLLLLSLSLREYTPPSRPFTERSAQTWGALLGVELTEETPTLLRGKLEQIPLVVHLCSSSFKGLAPYRISLGEPTDHAPDWVATSLPYVPLGRHLFPSLPRVFSLGTSRLRSFGLWDRDFFSDSIVDPSLLRRLERHLDGEIRIWWGSGLVYESPHPPPSAEDLKKMGKILTILAEKSLIL